MQVIYCVLVQGAFLSLSKLLKNLPGKLPHIKIRQKRELVKRFLTLKKYHPNVCLIVNSCFKVLRSLVFFYFQGFVEMAKTAGLQKQKLSEKTAVTIGQIAKIENGETKKPQRKTMIKLAEAFGEDFFKLSHPDSSQIRQMYAVPKPRPDQLLSSIGRVGLPCLHPV